jgi:hypothetical protein
LTAGGNKVVESYPTRFIRGWWGEILHDDSVSTNLPLLGAAMQFGGKPHSLECFMDLIAIWAESKFHHTLSWSGGKEGGTPGIEGSIKYEGFFHLRYGSDKRWKNYRNIGNTRFIRRRVDSKIRLEDSKWNNTLAYEGSIFTAAWRAKSIFTNFSRWSPAISGNART